MGKDNVVAIHPNPAGPTHAESPYSRKLKRVIEDMNIVLATAPAHQREDVHAVILQLDMLLANI